MENKNVGEERDQQAEISEQTWLILFLMASEEMLANCALAWGP